MATFEINGKDIIGDHSLYGKLVVVEGAEELMFANLAYLAERPTWWKKQASMTFVIKEGTEWKEGAVKEVELPQTLRSILWAGVYPPKVESIYYNGTFADLCQIRFSYESVLSPIYWCDHLYVKNDKGEWEDIKNRSEIRLPDQVSQFSDSNFTFFESCRNIYLHRHMKALHKKFVQKLVPGKTIYIDCGAEELANNPAFAALCEIMAKKKIPIMVPASGQQGGYEIAYLTPKEPEKAGKDGLLIKDNVLLRCDAKGDVVIPEGVIEIGKGAFNKNHKMKRLTLPSTLAKFGGLNVNKKITEHLEAVYFNGGVVKLNQVKASEASNPRLLSDHIYVRDENGQYRQLLNRQNLYFKTKGFDESFLSLGKDSFVEDVAAFSEAKKEQYPDSFNTIMCFEEGELCLVFECSKETFGRGNIELLYRRRIRFGLDDFLIKRYWSDRFENIFYHTYTVKCDLEVKDGVLMKCVGKEWDDGQPYENELFDPAALIVNLPKGAFTRFGKEAFADYNGIFLSLDVSFFEFLDMYDTFTLKTDFEYSNFIGFVLCRGIDFILWKVNHRKANAPLYYSGCHWCGHSSHRALEYCRQKQFYAFCAEWPGVIRETKGLFSLTDYAGRYMEDAGDEIDYSVFDFDNFCDIKDVDFEAG